MENKQLDVQQLTESLTQLTYALQASTRRTALLESIIRWGAIATLAVAVMTYSVINQWIGPVFADQNTAADTPPASAAQPAGQPKPATTVVEALNQLNQNLMVFGQMGMMMNAGMMEAMNDPKIKPEIDKIMQERGVGPQEAAVALAGSVMKDAFVVMYRLREDSDLIHEMITGENLENAMKSIGYELHLMNGALAAVPSMAANMNVMGHSMGKMNSWIPWAP